jgi:hydroxyacylglutathione hydrolase
MLYDSLHEKLLRLDDRTEVYPAHGAGSLCGRNMSSERSSTLGVQRVSNVALAPMSREAFVVMMTSGLPEQPAYFARDAEFNRAGAPALSELPRPQPMSPGEVAAAQRDGVLVLDVRPSEVYGPQHIPGSINIGLDGQFATWAGTLIPLDRAIVVVAPDAAAVDEAVTRLARVGFSSVQGYLMGGIAAWLESGRPTAAIPQLTVADLAGDLTGRVILDVRRPPEVAGGCRRDAVPLPLGELERHLEELDPANSFVVVCGSGYRSSIATSILEAHGFKNLANVDGGMNAYVAGGHPVVVPAPV